MPVGTSDGESYKDRDEMFADTFAKAYGATSQMKETGNIDLTTRPQVKNEDGSLSTVRSMSVGFDNGEVLIPTVAHDGSRVLSDDEAIQQYRDTGKHLGIFHSPEQADKYADFLHKSQEDLYIRRPLGASPEPAGALKPSGGTETPGNGEKAEKRVFYVNPYNPNFKITEDDLDTAINVGMAAGPGTMMGVKGIANLKGAAKTDALAGLGHAQILEAAAEHPDAIVKETGFFRGAEGRWRREIDDSKSSFDRMWPDTVGKENAWNASKEARLGEILDHPDLYEAYPHLKNIPVIHDPTFESKGAQWYEGKITAGTEAAKDQGVLMHEVQHAIQEHEGFAKGGSPGVAGKGYNLKLDPAAREQIEEPLRKLVAIRESGRELTASERAEADRLVELAKKYQKYSKEGDLVAFEKYQALAGEVESRNVDTRLLMTAAERRKTSPRWTEDTPRSKQIVSDKAVVTNPYLK